MLVSFLFFTFFAIKLAYIILLLCLYDLLLHLADSLFAGVTFLIHDSNVNVETALFLLKNICKTLDIWCMEDIKVFWSLLFCSWICWVISKDWFFVSFAHEYFRTSLTRCRGYPWMINTSLRKVCFSSRSAFKSEK